MKIKTSEIEWMKLSLNNPFYPTVLFQFYMEVAYSTFTQDTSYTVEIKLILNQKDLQRSIWKYYLSLTIMMDYPSHFWNLYYRAFVKSFLENK